MNKILIIGRKSFLGSNLNIYLSKHFDVDIYSFEKILLKKIKFFDQYTHIINTSMHPNYMKEKYTKKFDLDLIFVSKFKRINFFYIFLNSRKVYLQQNQITEKSKLKPLNQYAKNKLTTEKLLQRKIKKRLISLRISNVLGNRIFKNNRNNHKLFFDNFLLLKNKKYLIVNNDYKDFITIDQFCKVVMEIIKHNIYGIYNVSLGKKVLVSELISWLDKNFYKRIKFIDVQTDSFTLSNKKLLSRIQIHLTKNQVKAFCKKLL